jgi:SH3 domain-containing YSC84-like protein 1
MTAGTRGGPTPSPQPTGENAMRRFLLAAMLALLPLAAHAQTDQQALVDRATLTVQEMFTGSNSKDMVGMLRKAKGALVCPRVFRGAFFFGGSGGGCVLTARSDKGWSNPAFYTLGSGSFGLQIGVQDSEVVILILTDKGLQAVLNSQFKFGADAGIALATIGAGMEGSTTAALRADIVAFAKSRGLYAGISLQGSLISSEPDDNKAYYGTALLGPQIVMQGQGDNPGAAPLRETLARFANG